ncbi:MAG: hypothetical protein QXN91_04825 [Nitrososphaerota archaeon]
MNINPGSLKTSLIVAAYVVATVVLIFITPLYGDPAVVYWTGKVMRSTGFAYDPACSKNVHQLCVRAPLYYSLLAISQQYYRIVTAVLFIIFIYLQHRISGYLNINGTLFGLLSPPIYLLFSRTYVDTLTALLSSLLLLVLLKDSKEGLSKLFLFLVPVLLVLVRETSLSFPIFLLTLLFYVKSFRRKLLVLMFLGWIAGLSIYVTYLILSGGNAYSDFQPHIPTPDEVYRSIIIGFTPILPWEVSERDIQSYLPFDVSQNVIFVILFLLKGLTNFFAFVNLILALIGIRYLSNCGAVKAQLVFGSFITVSLLFLKGYIDFYRHLSFLLPIIPGMTSVGIQKLMSRNRTLAVLLISLLLSAFMLFFFRQVRSFLQGQAFDACEYLSKRPEISGISFFKDTAC